MSGILFHVYAQWIRVVGISGHHQDQDACIFVFYDPVSALK